MKKILIALIAIALLTQCTKDNILWIIPEHEYDIVGVLVKDNNGVQQDVITQVFPGADRVTFTKFNPLGVGGDGVVKVTRTSSQSSTYSGYYSCQWESYTITWTSQQVNEYHFTWSKESQRRISLKFSVYDPIIQGQSPSAASFWTLLDQDYVVEKDSRNQGQLTAETIALQSDAVVLILRK